MAIKLTKNNGNINLISSGKVIRGIDGGYYTPVIDAEGNLSWIASLEDMADVAAVNIIGPEGKQGEPGKDGKDGAQGPQGIQGIQGLPGKDGVDGKDGAPGKDGEKGEQGIQGVPGEKGEPGVYVGTTEPTDEETLIWINPEGTATQALATEAYVNNAISAAIGEIENGSY